MGQTDAHVRALVSDAALEVVAFDIFDTLLVRPLLNPESTKAIIAQKAGEDVGKTYLRFWAQSEGLARQRRRRAPHHPCAR